MKEKAKKISATAVEVILCIAFTLVIGMTVSCARNSSDADTPTGASEVITANSEKETAPDIETDASEKPEADSSDVTDAPADVTDVPDAEPAGGVSEQTIPVDIIISTPSPTPADTPILHEDKPADNAPKYENQELGFSMEFPDSWRDRYTVEANPGDESSTSVAVCTNWGGRLCSVFRRTQEDWEESGRGELVPVEYIILGENEDYVYVLAFAGDVQYDPENEEQVNTYYEMRDDLYGVKFEIAES